MLPGLGFGPGGRIIEVDAEKLRREAELIVEEAANDELGDAVYATVALSGLPIEAAHLPYASRWQWHEADLTVVCVVKEGTPLPAFDETGLRLRVLTRMARATAADADVTLTVEQQIVDAATFTAGWPTWRD